MTKKVITKNVAAGVDGNSDTCSICKNKKPALHGVCSICIKRFSKIKEENKGQADQLFSAMMGINQRKNRSRYLTKFINSQMSSEKQLKTNFVAA